MISWSSETGWSYSVIGIVFVTAALTFAFYRHRCRRKSLRRRDDGVWIWVEWHGGERTADHDPREPGGAWDSGGDGDGGD